MSIQHSHCLLSFSRGDLLRESCVHFFSYNLLLIRALLLQDTVISYIYLRHELDCVSTLLYTSTFVVDSSNHWTRRPRLCWHVTITLRTIFVSAYA